MDGLCGGLNLACLKWTGWNWYRNPVLIEGHRWTIDVSFETAKNKLGSTITRPARGMAGIAMSRLSCSPSP